MHSSKRAMIAEHGSSDNVELQEVASDSRSFKSRTNSKRQEALKAKQAARKFRGATMPNPSLGVSIDEFTSFTEHLKSSKRILALFGSGLSVSSGIATFRGADRLFRGEDPADFSNPEAFFKDPVKIWWVFTWRMMQAQNAKPNAAHIALAKLAQQKPDFFAINQNVDGLCERAGFPQSQLAQIHGTLFSMKCSKYRAQKDRCDYATHASYPVNEYLTVPPEGDLADPTFPLPVISRDDLPHCPNCRNLLRPNVVFFDEPISSITTERIYKFTSGGSIDLMLVVGTSAIVLPASMYIVVARNAGARIAFFNLDGSDQEPGNVMDGDWMFKGDAAVTVAEMMKGAIGNVGQRSKDN